MNENGEKVLGHITRRDCYIFPFYIAVGTFLYESALRSAVQKEYSQNGQNLSLTTLSCGHFSRKRQLKHEKLLTM
jgi:hypothetical protein